jgi:hypothetical protein
VDGSVIVFPAICPACASDRGRRIIPASPEVQTFRCGACRYEWSEPLQAIDISPDPEADEPKRWRPFRRKRE